jgi:Flp pilus assembly protein TadD
MRPPRSTAKPEPRPPTAEEALERGDLGGVFAATDGLTARGDLTAAREVLLAARGRWPQDARVAERLLDSLRRLGDAAGIRAFGRDVVLARLSAPDLHFALGTWAEESGEDAAAARAFARAARQAPDDAEPVVRLSRVFRRAGRADLAERVVRRAVDRLPDEAALHAALGYAFVEQGREGAAAAAFRDAVRLEPDWPTYREDLATALVLAERWREAAEAANAAVRAAPRSGRAWTALATACFRMGQRDVADRAFRQALALVADPSRVHGNYGLFLAGDAARQLEAARHLKTALEAHADWDEVRAALEKIGRR